MSMTRKNINRFLGLLMCLCLLIGALYVPVNMSAFAQSQTTVYDFSYCVDGATNKKAAEENGVGYYGWGFYALNQMLGGVQLDTSKHWAEWGGYRVHDKNGLCELEPSSTYIISMKIKVVSGVKQIGGMSGAEYAFAALGWGCSFDSTMGGQSTNYINGMSNKIVNILSSYCDSETYRLNTGASEIDAIYSDEWKAVTYEIKTPADFGGKDNTLSIWIQKWYGIECYIDDLSVTKLGDNQGVVVELDEYSGISKIHIGNIGDTVTLSDISDRAKQADHTFKGWFKNENRTEQVTEMTITSAKQTVYSDWDALVVYTFKNTLTGEDIIVNGKPGEVIRYPADLVDENGEQWFMGWYTTQACTVEFTDKYFSYSNKNLYSLFKSEIPELKQDFENYNKDEWFVTTATGSSGNTIKSNRLYFSDMMEKQSLITYNGSDYAVKFDWDSSMEKVKEDPHTYGTSTRYNQMDMYFWLGKGLTDKTQYVVTFKYKVEKTDADLIFYVASAIDDNIWGYCQTYTGVTVNNSDLKNEWQEISFPITTSYKNAGANTMYLGVCLSKNTDTVVYFDDVEIKALMQPYQSKVTISDGVNAEYDQVGGRGEAVVLEIPVHPNGAEFKGWYLDKNYSTPAENLVYERVPYTVYAKWGAVPLTFKDYPYPTTADNCVFGKLVHIDDSGLGIDDDYSLRFDYKGNYVYKVDENGKDVLYNTRIHHVDHCATIAQNIKDNTYYRITYNYKIIDANVDVKFRLCSGLVNNLWATEFSNEYFEGRQDANMNADGWQTISFITKTELKNNGNSFFLVFDFGDNKEDGYVDVVVDNVIVEKITGDYIAFEGNAEGAEIVIVEGKAGDSFDIPTVKFDKNQLLGWYTDKECTIPFTATVMPQGETVVYAKWKAGPMTFNNYTYYTTKDNCGFGKLLSIDKSGLGVDGDAAVRFDFKGSYVYKVDAATGEQVFYNTRATTPDHTFVIKRDVKNNTAYKISYKYKVLDANTSVSIIPYSGYYANIWVPNTATIYQGGVNTVNQGEATNWQTYECYITSNLLASDNGLKASAFFLVFNVGSDDVNAMVDVLVDDVLVEEVEPPYAMFNMQNGKPDVLVTGEVGEKINYPESPTAFGKTFNGWYSDKECTVPFTTTTFTEGMTAVVYAGYNIASEFTYDFEKYDFLPKQFTPGEYYMEDAFWKTSKYAKSGSGVIEFDRTVPFNPAVSFATIGNGSEQLKVDKNRQYIVTFSYCVTKRATTVFNMGFATARDKNCWDNTVYVTSTLKFNITDQKVGVWYTKNLAIDLSSAKYDTIFFALSGGADGIFLLDDVTITVVPEGYGAIAIDNCGSKDIPDVITGKIGDSYANRLPKEPKVEGKYFKGYYEKDTQGDYNELKEDVMKFGDNPKTVFARFIDYKVSQDFEGSYVDATKIYVGLNIFDFDYELYDATAEGNSRDNVTSGKYSLHRKGTSRYFESSAILTPDNHVAEGERYKVSFKVKMGKHLHTDGAIKIASSRNQNYSWDTTGDWYPVVALKDLADGEWHEVSYIYNSVESFFAIQTPGYAELFIDDVVFELITDDTPVSTPIEFTEYVPLRRDENGNITEITAGEIDVNSIVDASLKLPGQLGLNITIIIIIATAGALVVAGAVILLVVLKKKKAKKA